MLANTIFCYYVELGWKREPELVSYWQDRWRQQGWNAIVLTDSDAAKHPQWAEMQAKINTFPRLPGHMKFGAVNFCRWLAFAQINGAVADYDVFPLRPFPPREFETFYNGDGDGGPGFLVGKGSDYQKIVDAILAYNEEPDDEFQGIRHVSDMRILQKNKLKLFDKIEIIHCCYVPGCERYPLWHFGNSYLSEMTKSYTKMTKVEAVRQLVEANYHA